MRNLLILIILFLSSCSNNFNKNDNEKLEVEDCCCPHSVIYIQPFEDVSIKEAKQLSLVLKEKFSEHVYGQWKFVINTPINFPKNSKVNQNKYKAILLLNALREIKSDGVVIGITHNDICANIHNIENYGIVGYSFKNKNIGIVSDKRLQNKKLIWKPIIHEFMHAFFGRNHCPNNDIKCFMKDAKGKGNFKKQIYLCDYCKV